MARCGCTGACACVIKNTGSNVNVTGTGTSADPWIINYTGAIATCDQVSACIGGRLGGGLTYNPATKLLDVAYSAQSGNAAGPGTDGHLYVAAGGGPGGAIVWSNTGTTVLLSGEGTPVSPLKANIFGGGRAYVKDSIDINFSGAGTQADPVTAIRKALRLRAVSDNKQTLTSAWKKYPVETAGLLVTNGVGTVSGGSVVVNIPGYYVVSVRTAMYLNNPATATAVAYVVLRGGGSGELFFSAAGNGGSSCMPGGTMVMYFPARGTTLWAEVQYAGTVSAPHVDSLTIDLAFIGQ